MKGKEAKGVYYGKFIQERKKELERLYNDLPELSKEQKQVAEEVLQGRNVFLTGSPGCGKSVALLNVVRSLIEAKYVEGRSFYLTAPTGVAAYLIGGNTLHRSFSIPIASDIEAEEAYKNIFSLKIASWKRNLQFLIIDEISMVSGRIFNMIDYFLRMAKGVNRPFGGVTVLCVGDFCQLPPVPNEGEDEDTVEFAFETRLWQECRFKIINLTVPFRQLGNQGETKNSFTEMITRLRYGTHTEKDMELLSSRIDADVEKNKNGIKPTCLFTHKYMVRELNDTMLNMLETPEYTFPSNDYYETDFYKKEVERICPSPQLLKLKVGAQVMVTRNIYDDGTGFLLLANGTKGVVKDIGELAQEIEDGISKMHYYIDGVFENGLEHRFETPIAWIVTKKKKLVAFREQFPLMLCWAITVHKSQGQTINKGIICVDKAFASGQVMVAVSRFRKLEDFSIMGTVNPYTIQANERVIEFYQSLMED